MNYQPQTQFQQFMVGKLELLQTKIENVRDINVRQNHALAKHQKEIDDNKETIKSSIKNFSKRLRTIEIPYWKMVGAFLALSIIAGLIFKLL